MTVEPAARDAQHVRFTTSNGESYQADVVRMYQRNLSNGTRRMIRRRGKKWFFDCSSCRPAAGAKQKSPGSPHFAGVRQWCAYANELQSLLESAFRESVSTVDADSFKDVVHRALQCSQGHPLIIDHHWNHICNLCEAEGTQYRCSEECDYDICRKCSHQALEDSSNMEQSTVKRSLTAVEQANPGVMSLVEAQAVCKTVLASNVSSSVATQTLEALSQGQGLTFSASDARCAALNMGSAAVLQVVLCSKPHVQLLGLEIFDRRYPGLVLNDGVKLCVRMLLARGAQLGRFAPSSKLLRKIDADELCAWAQRYLDSMSHAGMELPEHVQHQVLRFLK